MIALVVIGLLTWVLSTIVALMGLFDLYYTRDLQRISVYTRSDLALAIGTACFPILQWVLILEMYSCDLRAWKAWWDTEL